MVDIPWIGPVTGKEKFIFSKSKNPSILFKLKKLIWGDRMQQVAKEKLIKLYENKNTSVKKVDALLKKIDSKPAPSAIDVTEFLEAFSKTNQADAFITDNLLSNLPEELASAVTQYETEQLALPVTTDELITTIEKYLLQNKLAAGTTLNLSYGITLLRDFHTHPDLISNLDDQRTLKNFLSSLNQDFQSYTPTNYLGKIAKAISNLSSKINDQYAKSEAEVKTTTTQTQNLPRWHLHPRKISQADYHYIAGNLTINMPVLTRSENNRHAYQAFLDFIEDPKKNIHDTQTRRHLDNFLNVFYEDVNKLDPKLRSACLIQIDRLEGVLQHHQKCDLHAQIVTDLNQHALATLHTLRNQIEINGPSSSMLHLFQYVLHRKNAIDMQSFWHLSGLSKTQKNTISESLPPETRKIFKVSMNNLSKDLKEFKQQSILNRPNLVPTSQDARRQIITHIGLKLHDLTTFKDNEKNKSALEVFLAQLYKTDLSQPSTIKNLEEFFSLFFGQIKQLNPDTRNLCLTEIDRLKGLLLTAQRADIESYDLTKLKNNSLIDFATALQLNAAQLGTSAFIMDLLHYLENGSKAITPTTYWALNHVATIKRASIAALLGSPQKTYFSSAMMQLTADLQTFKAAQTPSAPS
jgi:hypothetical protein